MRKLRNNELADRQSDALAAKAALLDAYRAAKTAVEPSRIARQAERVSLVEAREARRAERERVKVEESTRHEREVAEKQAAVETAAMAETEARMTAENALISRVVEDEAARKAERDGRYANRKAKQA